VRGTSAKQQEKPGSEKYALRKLRLDHQYRVLCAYLGAFSAILWVSGGVLGLYIVYLMASVLSGRTTVISITAALSCTTAAGFGYGFHQHRKRRRETKKHRASIRQLRGMIEKAGLTLSYPEGQEDYELETDD